MALTYRTHDGDTVDWIVWRRYGHISNGLVERVLRENPGLADAGPVLPAGIPLTLPEDDRPATRRRVRLWG